MKPEDFARITEPDHTWLSELPALPEPAAGQEHAYVVPWELHDELDDMVTLNSRVAFDDEWFGQ